MAAVTSGDFSKTGTLADSILGAIDAEVVNLAAEEAVLSEKAKVDGSRKEERQRLADLLDRKKLSETIATFSARLEDLAMLEKLAACTACLSIANVSPFITKLRKDLVTQDLQSRVSTEISAFSLDHIPFLIKDRVDDGKSVVGVKLNSIADVKNHEVLSTRR